MKCIRIYASWREETAQLTHEEKGRLIDKMVNYLVTGEIEKPEGNERFIYPVMIERISRELETHERRKIERAEARTQ